MFSVMPPPRHIAPSTSAPVTIAPVSTTDPTQTQALKPPESQQPVAATDVIFVKGQAFNGRGYQVCGVANQRGRLCGRIGQCPFHAKNIPTAKRPRSNGPQPESNQPDPTITPVSENRPPMSVRSALHPTVRRMDIPPTKSRFKRSWTTDEHRRFLQAMRHHGKGKWKEIAVDVKTRNANQCQSHAQKYFLRQAKSDAERKKKSIHDVTEEDVSNDPSATNSWPPINPLHELAQRAAQAPPVPVPPVSMQSPIGAVQIRPVSSGVALAPRPTAEAAASAAMKAQASSASLGLALPGDADSLGTWGASMPTSAGIPTAPGASNPNLANAGNATVPFMFPISSMGMPYAPMVSSLISAGNPAVAAPALPQPLRVTVHINGKLKGGMALRLPKTIEEFFEQAQAKLQFDGVFTRVFTRSAAEILSLDEMCQDDVLWLSTGDDFITPR